VTTSSQAASAILIREATAFDARALASVLVRSWRAAYRGIIDDDYLASLSVERRAQGFDRWFRDHPPSSFIRVAVDAQARPIGFAHGGCARGSVQGTLGEIYVFYLLPQAQRQGVGTQLMRSMARGLDLRGMDSLVIWALERNPARAFYDVLGGRVSDSRETPVGTRRLREVAYRWDDLRTLMAATRV
jgi:GNAT superfamily N-acetyltransferase